MNEKNDKDESAIFQPIRLERVADKVAKQLKKAISDGLLKVGDRLPPERELAEKMGVSRPSVREALQKLEVIGMVQTVHGGGTVVRNITEREVQTPFEAVIGLDKHKVVELTEVRACLETWAARQAAVVRTEPELDLIRTYLERMEKDLESGKIQAESDVSFHTAIAAATHNTIFLHLVQSIFQLIAFSIRIYREEVFLAADDQQTIFRHHLSVYNAIRNCDAVAAEEAMSEHLQFIIQEYRKRFLAEPEPLP
jgi:GntR family transcriptional regulator, transcriptional repressor for pyruvate dehydrogenase complex